MILVFITVRLWDEIRFSFCRRHARRRPSLFFSFKPTSPLALAPLSPPGEWDTPGIPELCAVLLTQQVEETSIEDRGVDRSQRALPPQQRAGEAEAKGEEVKHISSS